MVEAADQAIDQRNDGVGSRDGERAALTEVVLHVDHDQRLVRHSDILPHSDGNVSPPLFSVECGDPVAERAGFDRAAQAAHDVLVVMHVVPCQQHGTKNLLAADQVVQIGAAMVAAGGAGTVFVDRPGIIAVPRVAQVEFAAPGEGLRRAPGARRHHAVEHVDAALHRAHDVGRPADAHQIARLVGRELWQGCVEGGEHQLLAFADGEAADRVAVEADRRQRLGAFLAQGRERRCPARCRTARSPCARRRPAGRARPISSTAASNRRRPAPRPARSCIRRTTW